MEGPESLSAEQSEFVRDKTLQDYFAQIVSHVSANPADLEIVVTELNALTNKYDKDIKEGRKSPLPLINPDFKPRVRSVRERVWSLLGQRMKVPDLRFKADKLSREASIPLPNSTRKNNEALMQWFDSNWAQLAPKLTEMRKEETPKSV